MQLGFGETVIPLPQQVLGRAMLEDQENLIFTVQKAVHWLINYSFST